MLEPEKWVGVRLEYTLIRNNNFSHKSKPEENAIKLLNHISQQGKIIKILTPKAKRATAEKEIQLWLIHHNIPFHFIVSRIDENCKCIIDFSALRYTQNHA